MILYATKQTIERFKIKMPEEMHPLSQSTSLQLIQKEQGDTLLEWGLKMLYFDHRKCIQVMNFASKLTIFLIDIKVGDFDEVANLIALYLLDLYQSDKVMTDLLKKLFAKHSVCTYSRLKDKSIISSLNRNQMDFAFDGMRFYEYIENGVLLTRVINHEVNFKWFCTQNINGKTEYILPGERFKTLLTERYTRS